MEGASTVASHPWSWASTGVGDPTMPVPSGVSWAAQMDAGTSTRPSLDFQYRYTVPSPSTNGCGSMDPPRPVWQMSGPEDVSTNGPTGEADVAMEMHSSPVAATSVA